MCRLHSQDYRVQQELCSSFLSPSLFSVSQCSFWCDCPVFLSSQAAYESRKADFCTPPPESGLDVFTLALAVVLHVA